MSTHTEKAKELVRHIDNLSEELRHLTPQDQEGFHIQVGLRDVVLFPRDHRLHERIISDIQEMYSDEIHHLNTKLNELLKS